MFNLIICAAERRNFQVNANMTIAEAIEAQELSIQGATVSLDGRMLVPSDYNKKFADFGIRPGDTARLSLTVKAASAC